MKTLNSIAELSHYGIGLLTGEACPFGLRTLCDLTEGGRDLVASFLGANDLDCFPQNWNSSVAGVPSVASIMLTRDTLSALCVFVLFIREDASVVLVRNGTYLALRESDPYYPRYMEIVNAVGSGYTVYRNIRHPQAGGRNQHAMTGRTL